MDYRHEGKQSNSTRNIKHVNFVLKDVQIILSSRKSIMNRKCSKRKMFLKISQHSQENTNFGISFWIKMQAFRAPALLKRDLNTGVFANIEKILRTPILKSICERLLQRFSLKLFPIWTNNKGSKEHFFSKINKTKTVRKLSYMKKTCLFMMFFIISFFSFSPLHVRRHLPYIIKDDTSESFETA